MPYVVQCEFLKFDLYLTCGGKVGVQGIEDARSTGHVFDVRDPAKDLCSCRDNNFVKRIYRLSQSAVNGLASLPNTYFLINDYR